MTDAITYGSIYGRLVQEDLALRAQRREQLGQAYAGVSRVLGDVRDYFIRPALHATGKSLKTIAEGVKDTAKTAFNGAVDYMDIYANAQKYEDILRKGSPTKVRAKEALEDITRNARLDVTDSRVDCAKEIFSLGRGYLGRVRNAFANTSARKQALRHARSASGGYFKKYVTDTVANAKRYGGLQEDAEKFRAVTGMNATPLQMSYLNQGKIKEFFKYAAREKKKPDIEVTVPIMGNPVKLGFSKEEWYKQVMEGEMHNANMANMQTKISILQAISNAMATGRPLDPNLAFVLQAIFK